jgi:hypothetical protein
VDIKPGSPEAENCPPGFLVFPHMGFELAGMTYDPDRKLPVMGRTVRKDNDDYNKLRRTYNPVPYDLNFNLYIMSKNIQEGNQIVEQILPFFTPEFTSTVNLISAMDISHDIPVILNSVNFEDRYQGELTQDRRTVFWTLNFTMKAYFYGPVLSKPIIKVSNNQFFIGNTSTQSNAVFKYTVTPGLDANGAATSNADAAIAYANVAVDDDFGYVVVWANNFTDANTST